jgi:hypothetical protein
MYSYRHNEVGFANIIIGKDTWVFMKSLVNVTEGKVLSTKELPKHVQVRGSL